MKLLFGQKKRLTVMPFGWLILILICTQIHQFADVTVRFDKLSIEQGLSQVSVKCMIQDSRGYIWIGTEDGLNRYDGYRFKVFKRELDNPNSISDNDILSLYQDKNGIIWVGTKFGLNRMDPEREQFTHYVFRTKSRKDRRNAILTIAEDQTGELWIGTAREGLIRFEPHTGKWEAFTHDPENRNSLSHGAVYGLFIDRRQRVWIGTTRGGLNSYDPVSGRFSHFRNDKSDLKSLSDNRITALTAFPDRPGILIIGTWGGGINRFDMKEKSFRPFIPSKEDLGKIDPVIFTLNKSLSVDSNGNIWAGLGHGGLLKIRSFEKGRFEYFRFNPYYRKNTLSGNYIEAIFEDRSGNIWIGTTTGGISILRWQPQQFSHFSIKNFLKQANSITAFYRDASDQLWYGSKIGLTRIDLKKMDNDHMKIFYYSPRLPDGISGPSATAIFMDSFGKFWIGSTRGLNLLDPKTEKFKHYLFQPNKSDSISGDHITSICEDRDRQLWIGTGTRGVNRYDRDRDRFIRHMKQENSNSIGSNYIYHILQDPAEKEILWIGTADAGLDRFNRATGQFTHFTHIPGDRNSPSSNKVSTIHISAKEPGIIWLGTQGGGLNRFDKQSGSWRVYSEADGLSNNSVYGILEDKLGKLWISTNKGLSKLDPETGQFLNYYESDGLQGNEYNANSYYRDRSGNLYFGGINGFSYFNPEKLKLNSTVPTVVISDFKKFNRSVQLDTPLSEIKQLTLTYRDTIFSFEFAALEYSNPAKNRYAYRLDGFQDEWIETDAANRTASFTNIPHGSYVFMVRGSNNDGVWNPKITSIRILIMPPWWKTTWFKLLLFLLFLMLLFLLHRIRVSRTQKNLKQKITVSELCINYNLSKREKEVVDLLLLGKSNKDIEDELFISIGTVKNHIYNIFKKADVKNRNELYLKFKNP